MTSQNTDPNSDSLQPPQRISWKRHLELEAQTVEELRTENDNLNTDTEHYYQLVCRLAKDLQNHGVESKTLDEVLQMGWLEDFSDEPVLTDDQLERQEYVDSAIYTVLAELAGFDVEWDISLIGAVRDCISTEFQKRRIMDEMDFYPVVESQKHLQQL